MIYKVIKKPVSVMNNQSMYKNYKDQFGIINDLKSEVPAFLFISALSDNFIGQYADNSIYQFAKKMLNNWISNHSHSVNKVQVSEFAEKLYQETNNYLLHFINSKYWDIHLQRKSQVLVQCYAIGFFLLYPQRHYYGYIGDIKLTVLKNNQIPFVSKEHIVKNKPNEYSKINPYSLTKCINVVWDPDKQIFFNIKRPDEQQFEIMELGYNKNDKLFYLITSRGVPFHKDPIKWIPFTNKKPIQLEILQQRIDNRNKIDILNYDSTTMILDMNYES